MYVYMFILCDIITWHCHLEDSCSRTNHTIKLLKIAEKNLKLGCSRSNQGPHVSHGPCIGHLGLESLVLSGL